MTGKLEAIWIKRANKGPMDAARTAVVVAGRGIEGNANQGGKRQVTLLSAEAWQDVRDELGLPQLDPRLRRANLLLSGVDLEHSRGQTLVVGDVEIVVHGETRPCRGMEEAQTGLKAALGSCWRGGVYGEILTDGAISVGDPARWLSSESS